MLFSDSLGWIYSTCHGQKLKPSEETKHLVFDGWLWVIATEHDASGVFSMNVNLTKH